MIEWLRIMMRIALLKAGPQDLPASRSSMVLAIVLYWAVLAMVIASTNDPRGLPLWLLSFALQIIMIYAVLRIGNRLARFNQTATALFATAALLGLANLPLLLMADPQADSVISVELAMLIFAVLFWSLAVDGSIWRHALNRSFGFGLSIAVLLFIIHFAIMQSLGPPAAGS